MDKRKRGRLRIGGEKQIELLARSLAVSDRQLPGRRRQMPDRAVAFHLGRIESQLLVEVVEPDRLKVIDTADRDPAAHFG